MFSETLYTFGFLLKQHNQVITNQSVLLETNWWTHPTGYIHLHLIEGRWTQGHSMKITCGGQGHRHWSEFCS